jgi:4-aminobutyrate--pyruvate transaminase
MTMSKSIISGYLPFGAVGIREDIYQDQAVPGKSFSHGFTNSGHPVSCAVALRNLDIILEENLTANSAKVGAHLLDRLRELLELPWVGDVRGLGLLAAVELVADKETRAKFDPSANVGQRVAMAARDNGLLLRPIGDTIVMAPPLVITEDEVDALVDKLTASIEVLDISAGA